MIFHPNRVFLKPLESAVLVTPQGNYSTIFYIAFVFLLPKFWKRSEYDCSTMKCPFAPPGLSCNYDHIFSDRNDEKVACQKILDKIGLQGYQVKHTLLTKLLSMYQILTCFSSSQLSYTKKKGHTNKRGVNGTQLGTMFHKINPSIPRVIINKIT